MAYRGFGAFFLLSVVLCGGAPLGAQSVSGSVAAPVPGAATAISGSSKAAPAVDGDPTTASAIADYKLGVADHVRVNVYNEPDLSGEFTVSAAGTLSLPLIGALPVAGRTASEAASSIQARLAGPYLKDPHVSLEILTYRPFYILGEVTKPGEYAYSNGLTILNAVATAQGFTYRANRKRVFIKRSGETSEQRIDVAPDTLIQPGDTIRIGERHL